MNDHLARLQAMTAPGQRTWDLSPNDVAAIQWAVDEIARLNAGIGFLLDRIPTSEAAFSREVG